ncbi:MAG: amidohydrolase family protein [Nitrososphaeria archaeon]|jgi:cytosine deaminase
MIKITNVRLRNTEGLFTVEIKGNKISNISKYSGESGDINGMGNLLTESFVIPHVHIDKVETGDMIEKDTVSIYQLGGGADEAIRKAAEVKKHYDSEIIATRVLEKFLQGFSNGVTFMRVFADVDSYAELKGFMGVLKAKEKVKNMLDVEIVAFPQQGFFTDTGAQSLVEESIKKGADVVGGIPWIEKTDEDMKQHIKISLELAKKYNKPAAFLVDDAPDPKLKTLEYLADETVNYGLQGKVEACHARALEVYDRESLYRVFEKVKAAKISLVTNPHTGKYHLPVKEALKYGINVALGQDDCNDAYYPYGSCNPLEVAFLASHLLWMMDPEGRENIYDMITWRAATAVGTENKFETGKSADLVLLRRDNVKQAIRYHEKPVYVFKQGLIVSENL